MPSLSNVRLAAFKKPVLRSPSLNFANYWQRWQRDFDTPKDNQPREHSLASFIPDRWQAQEAFLQDQGGGTILVERTSMAESG